mgnify:CR=1 FL=1
MGGYSEKCPHCEKWFLSRDAANDHIKAKHPEKTQSTPKDRPNLGTNSSQGKGDGQ